MNIKVISFTIYRINMLVIFFFFYNTFLKFFAVLILRKYKSMKDLFCTVVHTFRNLMTLIRTKHFILWRKNVN